LSSEHGRTEKCIQNFNRKIWNEETFPSRGRKANI
jgi:hypothetical protein